MTRLFGLFSLAYVRHRPLKVFLTVLGMSVGIAVFTAIDLSNRSVLASLERTLDQTRGASDLSVVSKTGFLKDEDYARLLDVPGTDAATPVLEFSAYCPARPDRTLTLLGIDPVTRGAFFDGTDAHGQTQSFLTLLEENRLWVPPQVASACGLSDGHEAELIAGGRRVVFVATVPQASARKSQKSQKSKEAWEESSLLFSDIAVAQEKLDALGRLSRIEIKLAPGQDPQAWTASAQGVVKDLISQKKDDSLERGRNLLRAFQINLLALGFVSIFVAVFIVYNAASLSLLQRRSDLGNLRALGLSRRRLIGLFTSETLVLGALSGLSGLLLGRLLASLIFARILRTMDSLYSFSGGGEIALTVPTVLIALGIGLGGALMGSLIPLAEVASIAPAEAARQLTFERRFRRPVWLVFISLFCLAAWAFLARLSSVHRPEWSFLAALAGLLAFLFLTPILVTFLVRALEPVARRFKLPVLLVSCGQLAENPYRYGVVTAALSLGVALWLGVGLMVHSFRASVEDWVQASIRGDVYLILRDHAASGEGAFIPDDFLEKVKSLPGVAHADTLRVTAVETAAGEVPLSAVSLGRLMQEGIFKILDGDRAVFYRTDGPEPVAAVAESFARRMGLKASDVFTVQTPWGPWTFVTGAVLYDYTSERGQIYMEASVFAKKTGDAKVSGLALFLTDPSRAVEMVSTIRGWGDAPPSLEISPGADLRARVLRIFNETFQLTEALKYVAIFVAFLGIISTLSIVFEEKRWELGLLASLGLGPKGLERYGLSQGLLLSSAGFLLGFAAGLALCGNIIHLIHKSFFGWTIFFRFDAATVFFSLAATLFTGAAASFFLIRKLARLRPAEALRYDG